MAGPTIELPSVALRSANLRLQGNGQGAVSTAAYLAELPSLVDEIDAGTIAVKTDRCRWPTWRDLDPADARASAPYSCLSRDEGRCLGTGGVIRSVRAAL